MEDKPNDVDLFPADDASIEALLIEGLESGPAREWMEKDLDELKRTIREEHSERRGVCYRRV